MDRPKHKQSPRSAPKPARRAYPPQPSSEPEVVDPIWLVKAIGLTVLAALVCGYLALCLLFYQGQWQLVLHPSSRAVAIPSFAGAATEPVRFGIDESATPQMTGFYLPAAAGGRYAADTILYLPDGDGQLSDQVSTLALLHDLGLNVFAFDYRGYGMSLQAHPGESHPTQQRMAEDAASAWQYLTVSRGLKGGSIVPFGVGVGAALATHLAADHSGIPAVVIDKPVPDVLAMVRRDPRTSLLPVTTLFHERFEITAELASLKTPKLLVLQDQAIGPTEGATAGGRELALLAAEPKFVLSLERSSPPGMLSAALGRFLDLYLHP